MRFDDSTVIIIGMKKNEAAPNGMIENVKSENIFDVLGMKIFLSKQQIEQASRTYPDSNIRSFFHPKIKRQKNVK